MKVRTRFAPSPTGFMHIGNLRTGLYAYLFAKKEGGDFILRIEDTDRERLVEGAVETIYRTLKICGLSHDEGPDKDGGRGPYVQSERKAIYKQYAEQLVALGGAYYCFCTKERLETLRGAEGVAKYDKHCLSLSKEEVEQRIAAGEAYVIRQNVPSEGVSEYDDLVYGHISVDCKDMEDNILLKSDGMPTYNFANVVDDHLMGVTHVLRGSEYLSSTPKYNLLYDAFGWTRPTYIHLPLIMKDATRKLSKRYGDANFEDFLEKGYLPEAILNYIALLGWSPKSNTEKLTLAELTEQFDVSGINKSPAIFDEAKMRWLNGEYLKEKTDDEFLKLSAPWFHRSAAKGKYDYKLLASLLKTRVEILSELPDKVRFLEEFGAYPVTLFDHRKMKTDAAVAKIAVTGALALFESSLKFTHEGIHDALIAKAEDLGLKKGQMLWSVRVALTGKESTPGGAVEMAELLGREESVRRLRFSLELLNA